MVYHPDITRKDTITLALDTANSAVRIAAKQMTGNAGTVEIPNADGTSSIMGVGAGDTGVAQWVGDTTAPGTPTGITVTSGNGMIIVSWDGTLDGGVPPDFDHVAIQIDGVAVESMYAAGSRAFGAYETGSVHTVSAIAYDDAHLQDGTSAPNASAASDDVSVTVESSDIDPDILGITVTKSTTDPVGDGVHKGDLWLKYGDSMTAAWSGTTDASSSTLTKDGALVATNLATDPKVTSFTTLYGASASSNGVGVTATVLSGFTTNAYARTCETITLPAGDYVYSCYAKSSDVVRTPMSAAVQYETSTSGVNIAYDSNLDMTQGRIVSIPFSLTSQTDVLVAWHLPVTVGGTLFLKQQSLLSQDDYNALQSLGLDWFSGDSTFQSALSAEWWWDGTVWQAIPIAMYLDQLAVRDIQADSAVIGMLSAGIITSGLFQTASSGARVAINSAGITAYDANGNVTLSISASDGSFTANKGTITGATVRTGSSSSRTEMNNTGMTVYKGGTAYAHMGSDATYGIQAWNPVNSSMVDLSSTIFGSTQYQSSDRIMSPIRTSTGVTGWQYDANESGFYSTTGKIKVSFSYSNNTTTDNGTINYLDVAIFFTTSTHDIVTSLSNQVGAVPIYVRTGPSNSGLIPGCSIQLVSGLPIGTLIYPCWALRAYCIGTGNMAGSIRDRTIVVENI
ncbi:MAG: hypothetical protein ABF747_02240 [Bifidobacterium sp.]|uniref:Tail fiber protein n=1 Tax=Bifidobacterium fermentum TaxID=3059035 RepID=A0AB39UDV8_9BIFI